MVFYFLRFQQYISHITATAYIIHVFLWVSRVLGRGSELSCPRTLPQQNPEDPVKLEPRFPGLRRVKHFTTEPDRSPHTITKRFKQYICTQKFTSIQWGKVPYLNNILIVNIIFMRLKNWNNKISMHTIHGSENQLFLKYGM